MCDNKGGDIGALRWYGTTTRLLSYVCSIGSEWFWVLSYVVDVFYYAEVGVG